MKLDHSTMTLAELEGELLQIDEGRRLGTIPRDEWMARTSAAERRVIALEQEEEAARSLLLVLAMRVRQMKARSGKAKIGGKA
jgi:hypothetical protein